MVIWIGLATVAAIALSAAVLAVAGTGEHGLHLALLATARLAFPLFLPAYVGRAAVALFGSRLLVLRRHAKATGLAFATVMAVHLALVAWLSAVGAAPSTATFVVFGIAAFCTGLLALLSIGAVRRRLGDRIRDLARVAGLNYVACAFAADFLRNPFVIDVRHVVFYGPFIILAIAAPVMRVAAAASRATAPATT